MTVGTASYDFDADALYSIIVNAYANQNFAISYDCSSSTGETIDLEAIYEESCIEAKDATWDPETHQVVESQVGYEFDLEAAKLALAGANPGDVLKFPYVEILPEVETEALEGALFRDVLGTYTAKSTSSYNRDNNLKHYPAFTSKAECNRFLASIGRYGFPIIEGDLRTLLDSLDSHELLTSLGVVIDPRSEHPIAIDPGVRVGKGIKG